MILMSYRDQIHTLSIIRVTKVIALYGLSLDQTVTIHQFVAITSV